MVSGRLRRVVKTIGKHRWGILLALSLTIAACNAGGALPGSGEASPPSTSQSGDDVGATTAPDAGTCPTVGDTSPWDTEVTAQAETVQEGGNGVTGVALVRYPRPDYEGKPWSQWGQGVVAGDGMFYSAIGDHQGADGNSFIYEYDPATMTLTQIVDVLATVPHHPGAWGFGKIHSQMVLGSCGEIYVSTYWGSRRGLTFSNGYDGDLLLRLDPFQRTTENLGVILSKHGVASLAATPDGTLLYAEAADPIGQKEGSFVVLDSTTGELVFSEDDDAHTGYRNIAVGPDGSAFVSWGDTGLARYDPATNEMTVLDSALPGSVLRASTIPDSEGTIYGVTRDPTVFFTLDPDGTVTELGPAFGYTASMALAPDGERFYYIPDAHGGAWEDGTPLIAVDTATGESEVIVELNPLVEDKYGLVAGGTYNVVVSADGSTVFVGLNAGDPATRDTFGEIILAIVTLP